MDSLSPTRHGRRVAPPSSLERPPDESLSLQLALAWLFIKSTPLNDLHAPINVFTPPFVADILGVIAREAFEINAVPASYTVLRDETDRLVAAEAQRLARAFERRAARGQPVPNEWTAHAEPCSWMDDFRTQFDEPTDGCAAIDTIERDMRQRIGVDDVEPLDYPDPLDRLSPLGVYFRRLLVKLRKLTFNETGILARQVAAWCAAPRDANVSSTDYNWRKTQHIESRAPYTSSEARELTRVGQMERYEQAMNAGNYIAAYHVLVQFYDYQPRVGEATSNGMMPHKLLNLASFHYRTGGLASALEAVDEGIRLARRQDESACLQDALSLRQRIVAETDAAAWRAAEVPRVKKDAALPLRRLTKAATPLDELWALKTAVDLGEPVPVALRRVYTALGRTLPTEPLVDDEEAGPGPTPVFPTLNAGAWHAAQAGLWNMLGSQALAEAHEGMALASPDLDHETFVDLQVARAERAAARGDTDDALVTLLAQTTVENMDMWTYRVWARGVWGVLEAQASLAGDAGATAVVSGLRAEHTSAARGGPGSPLRDLWEPSAAPTLSGTERGVVFAHGYVTSRLERVRALVAAHAPPHRMLQDVLAALEVAAALGLWPLYRSGTVLLADVLLAMDVAEGSGMAAKADAELARVWDELVAGPDAAALARAALARAKAHAAMATALGVTPDALDAVHLASATQFADLALDQAYSLGARPLASEATLLRDLPTQLGAPPPTPRAELPAPNLADQARRVGEIVRLVGVRVAEGWR